MVGMQYLLLYECISIMQKDVYKKSNNFLLGSPIKQFWKWTYFTSYLGVVAIFVAIMIGISLIMKDDPNYWQFVGFASSSVEVRQ